MTLTSRDAKSGTRPISPAVNVGFTIQNHSFSDLKVDQLRVTGEMYKPFKGVRQVAMAGKVDIRF